MVPITSSATRGISQISFGGYKVLDGRTLPRLISYHPLVVTSSTLRGLHVDHMDKVSRIVGRLLGGYVRSQTEGMAI